MSAEKRIAAFFLTVEEDLEAAELLIAKGNRLAAFHLQQAIEKLCKAALLKRGIEAGVEHHIEVLLGRLPPDDELRRRLSALQQYSTYATAFRYPKPGGRLAAPPSKAELEADLESLREHVEVARAQLLPEGARMRTR